MDVSVLGIDLGKNSCSVVGLDANGWIVLRWRMRRDGVVELTAGLPACVMAMEACCGAHHLGRVLHSQGHQERLMSPEYVRPYVKAQKNDDRDAEAIAEAERDGLTVEQRSEILMVEMAHGRRRIYEDRARGPSSWPGHDPEAV